MSEIKESIEIQESIIEKVKTKLNISEEMDVFVLYKLLYDTRNNSHPDLYEENLREKAKNKFQDLDQLLKELKVHLDNLKFTQTPKELAIYEKSFESVIDKSRILDLEEKNKSLKFSIEMKESEIKTLKETIEKLQEKHSEELNKELKELYKPKDSNFLVLGISAFLIVLVNILAQMKSLKEGLLNIFPFAIIYLNYFLFTLLVIYCIRLFVNNLKYQNVQKISEELKSSTRINDFYLRYKKNKTEYYREKEYFTEKDVEEYLKYSILDRRYQKSLFYYFESITLIRSKKSFNHLRDIFIYNLITKGFIKIGSAKRLDREFLIE